MTVRRPPKELPKPRKRPSQARARFTVEVLYEAFVRIWRSEGPKATSMRAVAHEAGYAVGTLYEYFPNREALLSGYFRHCLDDLCARMHAADSDPALAWPARLRAVVSEVMGAQGQARYFDANMLLYEATIAGIEEHKRAFELLVRTWRSLLDAWPDLPDVSADRVETLVLTFWGAQRYALLLNQADEPGKRCEDMAAMLETLLAPRS